MKLFEDAQTLLRGPDSPVRASSPVDSDSALLEAARNIDHDALVEVFDRYAALLYRYALRLCHDPIIADQIVGDVFARLLEQLAVGQGPKSNLRSYLYQTTYHLVIDEIRYSKRRAPLEALDGIRYDESSFSTLEDRLVFEKVMQAVQTTLTPDQQNIIILRFLEGMSLSETAEIMGKQVNNVKVLQMRAIQRLQKALQDQDAKPDIIRRGIGNAGYEFAF